MLNNLPSLFIIFILGLSSCDPSTDSSSVNGCYQFKNDKNEVYMKLSSQKKNVTGHLDYFLFEKDKNRGKVTGKFHGDTLIADYIFESEGITSVREVAFLHTENSFTEGYGEMINKDGKMVFKDHTNIQFPSTMILKKVKCTD